MNRTLIAYSSKTGNTKKIGQAISEVVQADLVDIAEEPDIENYENIIVGYWIDKGKANKEADDFMKKIKGKNCGVFATLGAEADSDHAKEALDYGVGLLEKDNRILAKFICRGKIDPALTEMMKNLPDDHPHGWTEDRAKRHETASKHPNEADLQGAKQEFASFDEKISQYEKTL